MNNISKIQNTERQIQRLAAQRELYSRAKTIFGWQLLASGPLAVGFALASLAAIQFKSYAALWGMAAVLSDLLWLTPWTKSLRETAAKIQELFDCEVLVLPWDEIKAGKRPDPELVVDEAKKYEPRAQLMPPLKDWYDSSVSRLPLHVARLACQRSNCWWDAKQRRRYAFTVISSVVVVFFLLFLAAMKQGLTIEDFILGVAAPFAPALILGIRQFVDQIEAAARLDGLKEHAEKIWNEALGGRSEAEITGRSRALQNEIFENRRRSPLFFDWMFRRLRDDYESQMNHGVAEYVAMAKSKMKAH